MKKLLAVLLLASSASAGDLAYIWQPGFKVQAVQEACLAIKPGSNVTACTSVPVIEDSKLGLSYDIGGAFAPGSRPLWIPAGLGYNLLPIVQSALLWVVNNTTGSGSLENFKTLLAPTKPSVNGPDVQINLGVKWGWILSGGKPVGEVVASVGPRILF